MAKRSSPATPRHWTEADARGVLDDWKRSGETLEALPDHADWFHSAWRGGGNG